jgi:hypothetical protein
VIEVSVGLKESPRLIKIGWNFTLQEKNNIEALVWEYLYVFAWLNNKLKLYDPNIIIHVIILKQYAKPFRQWQRYMIVVFRLLRWGFSLRFSGLPIIEVIFSLTFQILKLDPSSRPIIEGESCESSLYTLTLEIPGFHSQDRNESKQRGYPKLRLRLRHLLHLRCLVLFTKSQWAQAKRIPRA